MSPRRRLALAALALLVGLGAAEAGARVFLRSGRLAWRPPPPFGRADSPVIARWLERQELERAEGLEPGGYSRFDPLLGWTARAGYASPDGRIHVNARGQRGLREYEPLAPRGVLRLIACGESFTFCEEVSDEEAWPACVEALGSQVEVLNLGVGGYGTDQALLRLTREPPGPAQAVLIGLMLENIGRNVNRYRPLWMPSAQPAAKPRYRLTGSGLELLAQPFGSRDELERAVRDGSLPACLFEHEYWSADYLPRWLQGSALARLAVRPAAYAERDLERLWSDVEGEPFRTTLALLEAFRGVARGLGAERVLVLVFPPRPELRDLVRGREPYWRNLLDALERLDLECLDLSVPLAAAARDPAGEGVDGLYAESHYSPLGNRVVAGAVSAWIERAFPGRR